MNEYSDKIFTFDDFLTNDECNYFINQINNKKNKRCFTDSGAFENDKYIDLELAQYFYNKIKNLTDLQILRPNNLIMTGKYVSGDSFNLHTDTGLFYDRKNKEKSRYTLLIYLNDDFISGETEFYTEQFKKVLTIKPKKGKALLFDIDLWHKGNTIIEGNKYWIGCEIIGPFS
jgi:prolyl 4-hydroxylase